MIKLSDFGYKYDIKDETHLPEAKYLKGTPEEGVIWGMCFEEPRDLGDVIVELEKPMGNFDSLVAFETFTPFVEWINSKNHTWHKGHFDAYPVYPEKIDDNTFVYRYHMIKTSKIRFRMAMPCGPEAIPRMNVTVYGISEYTEKSVTVETGLWGHKVCPDYTQIFEIYNGEIISVSGTGKKAVLSFKMTDKKPKTKDYVNPDRTVITVNTDAGKVSFLPADLQKHPYIQIPDFGVLIYDDEKKLPCGIQENIIYNGEKIRDAIKNMPQRTFEMAEADIGLKHVNMTSETLSFKWIEPKVSMNIPDKRMKEHWHKGLSHIMAFCNEEADGKWNIRIGPYPMFGMESSPIIKMIDYHAMGDITEGALEKFLDSYSVRTPEGLFSSKEGCLCMAYGVKSGDSWLCFDPPYILIALAEHYFVTRDKKWLEHAADKMLGCIDWIYNEIDCHNTPGAWDEGLMPPSRHGDISAWFSSYWGHGIYYLALKLCNKAVSELGGKYESSITVRMPRFLQYETDVRKAYRKNLALTPVIPLKNGTFAPGFASCAYMRGFIFDIYPVGPDNGLRNAWLDADFSLKIFEAGVFEPEEIETKWALDAFEDYVCLDDYLLPKKWDFIGADPVTRARDATCQKTDYSAERDWYAWGGTGWQNGYCPLAQIYLIRGEVNSFLRTFYNTYALEADPDNYWFREHAGTVNYPPKTFEEAMSLYRLRGMVVFEYDDTLYLNRCVPDRWFADGFEISGMLTFYGILDMRVSRVDGSSQIKVELHLNHTAIPEKIILRVVHPNGKPITNFSIKGADAVDFNVNTGEITLNPDFEECTVICL